MGTRTITAFIILIAMVFAAAPQAAAQGNPTGTIRGTVVDPDGLPLPGVTVTVASPALQGTRDAVTSAHGDFIVPFLPPGEYTVTFALEGFAPQKQTVTVAIAETQPLAIKLALASVQETVTVSATASTEVLKTGTIAATYTADKIDQLPIGRTLTDAVKLAPAVSDNGPAGNIVLAGALSYEGLYLINGVNVNEVLRGQPRNLFIEDAIQETKISVGNISAEFGRFNGGVVNMITKSGGNKFSGSFRDSLDNDSWRALRPMGDSKLDKVVPTYEGTLGGPIQRDALWFFSSARYNKDEEERTLSYTNLNYPFTLTDKRFEGKGTYAITKGNTIRASYGRTNTWRINNSSNDPMDLASLYNNGQIDSLTAFNYTSILSPKWFLEGQFSRKTMTTNGTGSIYTDLVKGTLMFDRSRGSARFNSPTFCAVCGDGWHETRNNWDWFVKATYFLSTSKTGSHSVVVGVDTFDESRKVDNYQSGSGYRVYATKTYIADTPDRTIYPVIDGSSYVQYTPLVEHSIGNMLRTYSAFANDQWQLNSRLSFNAGVRFDLHDVTDQGGVPVLRDRQWSPRLGVSYDLAGNGKWVANAGFANYVMGVNSAVADYGSKGGRTASYSWTYTGAPLNTTCTPPACLTAADILPPVFAWFDANGGTKNTTYRSNPSIPGVTRKVSGNTIAPSSDEYTAGVARELGKSGVVRLDYMYRKYRDMYGSFVNTSTGKVTDDTGRTYDFEQVMNTPDAKRWYQGLTVSADHRRTTLGFGGSYTLSYSKGNSDGEDVSSGPIMASINAYPEYRAQAWNYPDGFMMNDQRHKVRLYATYVLPVNKKGLGTFTVGLLQRITTGSPYDIAFAVDSKPYVTPVGYTNLPATVTYYIDGRGPLRTDTLYATDLSFNWSTRVRGSLEVFFRGLAYNIFNQMGVRGDTQYIDTTVSSNASPGSYPKSSLPVFNPFTETPVEGVNYRYGPNFGQPTGPTAYQGPRSFQFSFGVRF